MARSMITANRLEDGAVIWLGADGEWLEAFDRAASSDDEDAVARLLATAGEHQAAGRVIGAYEIKVEDADDGRTVPVRLRERIRVGGPTVAFG